eukprot:10125834-Ditylum_brightwellii.AAC.1
MPMGVSDTPCFDGNNAGTTSISLPNKQQADGADSGNNPPAENYPHPNHSAVSSNAVLSHQAYNNWQEYGARMDGNEEGEDPHDREEPQLEDYGLLKRRERSTNMEIVDD